MRYGIGGDRELKTPFYSNPGAETIFKSFRITRMCLPITGTTGGIRIGTVALRKCNPSITKKAIDTTVLFNDFIQLFLQSYKSNTIDTTYRTPQSTITQYYRTCSHASSWDLQRTASTPGGGDSADDEDVRSEWVMMTSSLGNRGAARRCTTKFDAKQ